jgi:exopolysaccharide production protein ExoZ
LKKLQSIQMLRGFAAVLVVLYHTQTISSAHTAHLPFGGMFSGGFRGVDLFFVLSGFIISSVHRNDLGRPERLMNYLFNRFSRIYPAVWIMSGFALAVYLAGYGGAGKADKLSGSDIVASFLLLPQLGDALVNVTWTLKYELFFYVVFASLIVNLRLGVMLLLLWQLSALALSPFLSIYQLGLPGFYVTSLCLGFGIGIACAWAVEFAASHRWLRNPALQWALLLAGIAMFLGGMASETGGMADPAAIADNGVVTNHTWSIGVLCALGSGVLILSLVLLEQGGRIRVPTILMFLGDASYAIYIVHYSIVTLLVGALVHYRGPMNDAVCIAIVGVAVVIGSMFYCLVDKPIQKVLRARVRPVIVEPTKGGSILVG